MAAREARFRARRQGVSRPPGVDAEAVMRVLRVPPELAGTRLDRFLQTQLRATSRTRAQRIIAHSAFREDGQPLKKNHRLDAEERVVLWRPPWDGDDPEARLAIVYEDEALIAIDKPPFVAVHPTARHHRNTVAVIMAAQRPDDELTLIHRLDRETSGVLLLARTRAADRAVKLQFEERRDVDKRYLAIAWGWPTWDRHLCELPLEPDADSPYRVQMRTAAPGQGLPSATTFEVLGRRRAGERRYALLSCVIHTGRQHQIRVHARALGLPLVGDKLYGPDPSLHARGADGVLTADDLEQLELERQALHAAALGIDHPTTGARLTIEAPLHEDLQAFWDRLTPA